MSRPSASIFTGGPDTTACALWAMARGLTPWLITFKLWGESQDREVEASKNIAQQLGLKQTVIDLTSAMRSFQMDSGAVVSQRQHSKKRIPFNAGVRLSMAASFAAHNRIHYLIWAASHDDFGEGKNPEYSQYFASELGEVATNATGSPFQIDTPFAAQGKSEILKWFKGREALFAATWSCTEGRLEQCGTCDACTARRESANRIGLRDYTDYASKQQFHFDFPERGLFHLGSMNVPAVESDAFP